MKWNSIVVRKMDERTNAKISVDCRRNVLIWKPKNECAQRDIVRCMNIVFAPFLGDHSPLFRLQKNTFCVPVRFQHCNHHRHLLSCVTVYPNHSLIHSSNQNQHQRNQPQLSQKKVFALFTTHVLYCVNCNGVEWIFLLIFCRWNKDWEKTSTRYILFINIFILCCDNKNKKKTIWRKYIIVSKLLLFLWPSSSYFFSKTIIFSPSPLLTKISKTLSNPIIFSIIFF